MSRIGAGSSIVVLVAILGACSKTSTESSLPPDSLPPLTEPTATIASIEAFPAEVLVVSISDLGLPQAAMLKRISSALGEALVRNGTFRLATPEDPGVQVVGEIVFDVGGAEKSIAGSLFSTRPTEIRPHLDADEAGNSTAVAPPVLHVIGLGPGNTLLANALTFKVDGAPALDSYTSRGFAATATGVVPIDWTYDDVDRSFSISGAAYQQFLSALPAGPVEFAVGFTSRDAQFAQPYSFLALKPSASISGQMVDEQGSNVSSLANRKVALRGFGTQLRKLALIDSTGKFTFTGLVPETYDLTLVDLERPNQFGAIVTIEATTSTASVTITYLAADTPQLNPLWAVQPRVASPSSCESFFRGTGIYYPNTVDNPGRHCNFQFTLSQGTPGLVVVASLVDPGSEVPFSYFVDLDFPGGAIFDSRAPAPIWPHDPHAKFHCFDVSAHTQEGPVTVRGYVAGPGNVQLVPIPAPISSLSECSALTVMSASFQSPNTKGYGVFAGPGQSFFSIPISTSKDAWGVPLTISYSPSGAVITDVKLRLRQGNTLLPPQSILGQVTQRSNGFLKIENLVLPPSGVTRSDADVHLLVQVEGMVDGQSQFSRADQGEISFRRSTKFTPLYLAGDEPALMGPSRRFGQIPLQNFPDPEVRLAESGGDSWATNETIEWLLQNAYRFNDISALHVARKADKSLLGHLGHSSGTQVDVRYADGLGGYSDLGDPKKTYDENLLQLLSDAQTKGGVYLDQLVGWILANRAIIASQAMAPETLKIFVGKEYLWSALVWGEFRDGSEIPGISVLPGVIPPTWAIPMNVFAADGHLDHWHIDLRP